MCASWPPGNIEHRGMLADLDIPDHHRAHRPRWIRRTGGWLLARRGWRIVGDLPEARKLILAVGPHTSNWDFFVGVAAMLALDMRIHWLGKHSLFHWPLGPVLAALGGMAVNRGNPEGVAEQIGVRLRQADEMMIAITPEGTRGKVSRLKTGFVRIARAGGCPVLPVTLDFAFHEIRLHEPFSPGEDAEDDARRVREIFASATPCHPENF